MDGKVAIITGSSRGIGKAIAIDKKKKGASIVLNGRNEVRLAEAKAEILKIHNKVITVCCDVSQKEAGEQLINAAIDKFGKLDILVNNVGVSSRGKVADLNPEVFESVFSSNLMGTVNPTIPAIPELRKTQGSIVFISSYRESKTGPVVRNEPPVFLFNSNDDSKYGCGPGLNFIGVKRAKYVANDCLRRRNRRHWSSGRGYSTGRYRGNDLWRRRGSANAADYGRF